MFENLSPLFQGGLPFLLGLVIGWLAELILDIIFWGRRKSRFESEVSQLQDDLERSQSDRAAFQQSAENAENRIRKFENENNGLRQAVAQHESRMVELEGEKESIDTRVRQVSAVEQANNTLRDQLSTAESRVRELEQEKEQLQFHLSRQQSDADVSVANYNALQASLGEKENHIAQLINERDTLQSQVVQVETRVANLEIDGDSETMREQLATAESTNQNLRNQLAALQARVDSPSAGPDVQARLQTAENDLLNEHNKVVAAEVKLQNMADKLTDERLRAQALERRIAELEASQTQRAAALPPIPAPAPKPKPARSKPAPVAKGKPDDLTKINGIGKVFASRLNAAGVTTFAQLTTIAPDRIKEMVQAKEWQAVDPDSWIEEARQFAQGA